MLQGVLLQVRAASASVPTSNGTTMLGKAFQPSSQSPSSFPKAALKTVQCWSGRTQVIPELEGLNSFKGKWSNFKTEWNVLKRKLIYTFHWCLSLLRTYPGNRFCHYPPILLTNVPSLQTFILSFFLLLVISVWCWSTWGINVFLRRTFSPLPISLLSFLWHSFIDFAKSEVMIMCLWEVCLSVCLFLLNIPKYK